MEKLSFICPFCQDEFFVEAFTHEETYDATMNCPHCGTLLISTEEEGLQIFDVYAWKGFK